MVSFRYWLDVFGRQAALREFRKPPPDLPAFEFLIGEAETALESGATARAEQVWIQMREWYPDRILGPRKVLELLFALARFDEAEKMMLEGVKKYPRVAFFAEGLAFVALRRGDIDTAIIRWERCRRRFPMLSVAYIEGAVCLARQGRFSEAESVLAKALWRFPGSLPCLVQSARIADERKDWAAAFERWHKVGVAVDDPRDAVHGWALLGMARSLMERGRLDEAEPLLAELISARPGDLEGRLAWARLADLHHDYNKAVLRWKDIRARFPANEEARVRCEELAQTMPAPGQGQTKASNRKDAGG